uniref:Major surface glycoprotein G n=2 Tax=Human respiratory syncytial virus A (strain rsb6190) TaxID=11255 RepID=GLYC_HRSV5|nr:RecName: Full=Major surface glycoprotein G; AltName: Full=Attachment glycoprotein G; AltName: Full=Membrane-bound glycoprotein; Short=mG; Contains: RecName: Full=Mature secreted glycoprotein G; Short=Mature sG [Human respiratory syncytial virus (strain RSB6190)]
MSKTKDQRTAKTLEKTWDTLNHLLFISSCLYKLNLKSIAQITLSILAMIISTSLIIAAIIFIASANNKVTLTTAIIQDATSQIKNTTPTYLTQNPQLGISFFNLSGTTSQTTAILALTTPSVESILQSTTVKTKNTTTTQIQPSKPTTKQRQNKPPNKPNNDFHFEVFNFVPCSICSNNPTCWAICKRIPSKKPGKKTTTKPTKKPTIKTTKKDHKPQTTKPKEAPSTKPTEKPTINITKPNIRTTLLTNSTTGNLEHTSQEETLHSTSSEGNTSPSQVYTTSEYLSQPTSPSNITNQ